MSAYIVDQKIIDTIVSTMFRSQKIDLKFFKRTMKFEAEKEFGQMLLDYNVLCVNRRYPNDPSEKIIYKPKISLTNALTTYKALEEFLYQCDCGKERFHSLLQSFKVSVGNILIHALPGYEETF